MSLDEVGFRMVKVTFENLSKSVIAGGAIYGASYVWGVRRVIPWFGLDPIPTAIFTGITSIGLYLAVPFFNACEKDSDLGDSGKLARRVISSLLLAKASQKILEHFKRETPYIKTIVCASIVIVVIELLFSKLESENKKPKDQL